MIRFYRWVCLGVAASSLLACGAPAAPPAAPAADSEAPRERLGHIVEKYWDETASLSPWYSWGGAESRYAQAPPDAISPQALADALAIERRYLDRLHDVSRGALDADAKLTYDIFRRERELTIEGFTYPAELLPVNAYDSVPQRFALLAAAAGRYALTSAKDVDTWQAAAASYEHWTQQAIANLREGMRRGYTLPRVSVVRTLPQLAALGEDAQTNVFIQALAVKPDMAPEAERQRLASAVGAVVRDKILPSYRMLHDFLQHDYLPRSRDTIGLSALPLGDAWYAYLVKRATGGAQTAAELHSLGLTEVERVRGRLQALLAETAFPGNAPGLLDSMRRDPRFAYSSAESLLNAVQDLKTQSVAALPSTFSEMPKADFEILGVEAFRQATTPALSYRRSLAYGKTPAVLYVDTAQLESRPATWVTAQFLREAVPGHHFQLALQQERADLAKFRRFGGAPAFVEGWALYAASLGEELGLYRDPQAKFGMLLGQLSCAAGVVIDTGIHAQQWTRQRAIDYLHAQMPIDDESAANAVDRDLALPGDALACTGFWRIQGVRTKAQQLLGPRFDVRTFHTEILKNGAVPLDLLELAMKQWMDAASTLDSP
jgi:uncharacterized protein (DUF885 family)